MEPKLPQALSADPILWLTGTGLYDLGPPGVHLDFGDPSQ